jgi:predicted NBD/HSP70 family sugar kinase
VLDDVAVLEADAPVESDAVALAVADELAELLRLGLAEFDGVPEPVAVLDGVIELVPVLDADAPVDRDAVALALPVGVDVRLEEPVDVDAALPATEALRVEVGLGVVLGELAIVCETEAVRLLVAEFCKNNTRTLGSRWAVRADTIATRRMSQQRPTCPLHVPHVPMR